MLTSSENDVDANFLKQDIPAYLQILETLIDSGYSHYNISRERKFPTIINIFKESDRKKQPPEKKKTPEEVTTIAAIEYTPKDMLTTGFDDIGGCIEAKTAVNYRTLKGAAF